MIYPTRILSKIIAAINGIGGYLMVHDAVVLARCIWFGSLKTDMKKRIPVYHTPCDMEVFGRGTKVLYDDGDQDVLNLNQRQRTLLGDVSAIEPVPDVSIVSNINTYLLESKRTHYMVKLLSHRLTFEISANSFLAYTGTPGDIDEPTSSLILGFREASLIESI
nr:dehydroascorbate reductase 2 [Tanacetum cinerariifolium]